MRLRDNLYWCECGGRAVFLDLQADRYFCLSVAASAAFLRLAANKPEPGEIEQLHSLIDAGLLVDVAGDCVLQLPARIQAPERDIGDVPAPRPSISQLMRALLSEIHVTWVLRTRPFDEVIRASVKCVSSSRSTPANLDRTVQGIVAGSTAIALLTRSHDRCLVRALSVHSACCKKQISTKLVVGVIGHPFAAHCWVQLGSSVLVGSFEQARLYTPILVVG